MMLETSGSVVHAASPPPETMDRMMRAATYGSNMLENAVLHHQPEHPPHQHQHHPVPQSSSPARPPPQAQLDIKPPESEVKPTILPNPKKTVRIFDYAQAPLIDVFM